MRPESPSLSEFASWHSYQDFARRVRHTNRYVWDDETKAFLATVLATIRERDVSFAAGVTLYRAQDGIEYRSNSEDIEEPFGFGAERMKPRTNAAHEGRANPAGLPVLYLATTPVTAVSEVRPWIGAQVSVARFELVREIRAINLSKGHGQSSFSEVFGRIMADEEPTPAEKEKAVWIDIDSAFSRPVTRSDDAADYVPTQILAEVFRSAGYDAVLYKSHFGDNEAEGRLGYNVVLFDVADADAISCAPFEVNKVEIAIKQCGNPWAIHRPLANEEI